MNVLFVCTGNVTRSYCAEILASEMFAEHSFRSAGTRPSTPWHDIFDAQAQFVQPTHKGYGNLLTKGDCVWADSIVTFEDHHTQAVEKLGFEGHLFNVLAGDSQTQFYDDDTTPDPLARKNIRVFLFKLVAEIHQKLPTVILRCKQLQG